MSRNYRTSGAVAWSAVFCIDASVTSDGTLVGLRNEAVKIDGLYITATN
jgi:hypothetical protein